VVGALADLARDAESTHRTLYYLVDTSRAGLTGFHETTIWISVAVTTAVAAGTFLVATAVIARGCRLKP
jgi:hypothetical protein